MVYQVYQVHSGVYQVHSGVSGQAAGGQRWTLSQLNVGEDPLQPSYSQHSRSCRGAQPRP